MFMDYRFLCFIMESRGRRMVKEALKKLNSASNSTADPNNDYLRNPHYQDTECDPKGGTSSVPLERNIDHEISSNVREFYEGFVSDIDTSSDEYFPKPESSSSDSNDYNADGRKRRRFAKNDGKNTRSSDETRSTQLNQPCNEITGGENNNFNDLGSYVETNNSISLNSQNQESAAAGDSGGKNDDSTLNNENANPRKKHKLFPPRDNKSRKRKRNPEKWKKKEAASLRERGQGYKSYSGKDIERKNPNFGVLCTDRCPFQCNTKFNTEQRKKIFDRFYQLDINAKNAFLFNCISLVAVQRMKKDAAKHKSASYQYIVKNECNNVRVCKTALSSLFQIGRGKIDHIQNSIKTGCSVPPPDCRGKHMNRPHKIVPEVVEYIEEHIRDFPSEESHYSRHKNIYKKYLSPLLSLTKMFQLYKLKCVEAGKSGHFNVAECTYRHIFSSKFNLSFGHPRSDTCSTCDLGEVDEIHVTNYREAFDLQKLDRELPKERNDIAYLTVDLQQTMPLPKLTVSKAFYLRQMWFYNLGVHIITNSKNAAPNFFTWTEDVACRGSNEVASCLLTLFEFDESLKNKDHLIIWSDSCSGQNKNSTMLFFYQYLILKGYFKVIEHKFPEVGHSYLDSDRDFGRIEKNLRKYETIFLPDQYREIIVKSGKNNRVTDMTQHFRNFKTLPNNLKLINRKKNVLNEKMAFRDGMKWLRVEEFGSYLYKDCYDPYTPFKKVDLFKKSRGGPVPIRIGDVVDLERTPEMGAKLSPEKIENLQQQLPYIKNEYKYFYESVIRKEKEKQQLNTSTEP